MNGTHAKSEVLKVKCWVTRCFSVNRKFRSPSLLLFFLHLSENNAIQASLEGGAYSALLTIARLVWPTRTRCSRSAVLVECGNSA